MRPSLVGGAILAVATALMILVGEAVGFGLHQVALLGGALGAALGLVPDRTLPERAGGFLVGFLLVWLGYALRAGFLPDISAGRALAAVIVIGLCLVVVFVSVGRLPLWSMLLGIAALVGAYEETYTATPARFVEQSASAAPRWASSRPPCWGLGRPRRPSDDAPAGDQPRPPRLSPRGRRRPASTRS